MAEYKIVILIGVYHQENNTVIEKRTFRPNYFSVKYFQMFVCNFENR
jgi:hypothetical protein